MVAEGLGRKAMGHPAAKVGQKKGVSMMVDSSAGYLRIDGLLPLEKAESVLFLQFFDCVEKREFEAAGKLVGLMKELEII